MAVFVPYHVLEHGGGDENARKRSSCRAFVACAIVYCANLFRVVFLDNPNKACNFVSLQRLILVYLLKLHDIQHGE